VLFFLVLAIKRSHKAESISQNIYGYFA